MQLYVYNVNQLQYIIYISIIIIITIITIITIYIHLCIDMMRRVKEIQVRNDICWECNTVGEEVTGRRDHPRWDGATSDCW